jgi:hypothetical protein
MLKASSMSKQMKSMDDCGRSMSFKALKAAFSLDTSPMSQEAAAIAERELRETPEQVQKSLAELRQLLKGTSELLLPCKPCWKKIFQTRNARENNKVRPVSLRVAVCDFVVVLRSELIRTIHIRRADLEFYYVFDRFSSLYLIFRTRRSIFVRKIRKKLNKTVPRSMWIRLFNKYLIRFLIVLR